MSSDVYLRPRKCFDGKIRMKPLRGYNCINWKWHDVPHTWSECIYKPTGFHKDCAYENNPWDCPGFTERTVK